MFILSPFHSSMIKAETGMQNKCVYICTSRMSDAPAEADKSFLLPLTSSILRAQELISDPDLEASPFAQNNKNNRIRREHLWKCPFLSVTEIKCYEFACKHRSKSFFGWIDGYRQVLTLWGCCIAGPKVSKARENTTIGTKSSCRLLSCRDISVKPHWNSKGKVWQRTSWNSTKAWPWGTLLPLPLNGFTRASAWLWGVSDFTNARRLHRLTLIMTQLQ